MSFVKNAVTEILDSQDGHALERLEALQAALTQEEAQGSKEAHYSLCYLAGVLETPVALLTDLHAIHSR